MASRVLSAVLHKEGKWYVAECPEVGTVSQGRTLDEAVANLKEAVELYFEGESDNAYTPVSELAVGQEMVDA